MKFLPKYPRRFTLDRLYCFVDTEFVDTELRVNLQQQVYIHCVLVHRGFPVRCTMCGEAAVNLVEAVFLEGDVLRQFLLGKIRCLCGLDIGMERAA